ncbi:hypothetical protein [Ruminiclostridium papyrosolvens]|uniref:Uncharacterized protein n=1 Tax=Ruminiclostridium papyrosolvens C7 TaxID=1330534 RepID=U4QYZ8_9FIRM|nr:hypothetical protein [Ruminiclostridium papyrosolvens]EPR10175.1 hypothetical protein L323_14450 [Ruminiclostridium papyrosolvens C7]
MAERKLSKEEFTKLANLKQKQKKRIKARNELIKANEEGKSEYFAKGNYGTW